MTRPKSNNPLKSLTITITNDQYNYLESKSNKSQYIRSLLEQEQQGKVEMLNTQIREQQNALMKTQDEFKKYNKIVLRLLNKESISDEELAYIRRDSW